MTAATDRRLFCFGLGYSAGGLARDLRAGGGWTVAGTCRTAARQADLRAAGIDAFVFDGEEPMSGAAAALEGATHVLVSIPPAADGDPVLRHHRDALVALRSLAWAGYLSTTGVYGDTGGAVVDETAPLNPSSTRSRQRLAAEDGWLALHRDHGLPVHVFRLAGIYGPGRSALDQVRAGQARRIDKPDQVFSRIHVDDIARVLTASMDRPDPGTVYNVCDDEPAPPADVVAFACGLLGRDPPPFIPFEVAAAEMTPMALSFWRDNRRVSNRRIRKDLGVALKHPDYRSGLRAILAEEG